MGYAVSLFALAVSVASVCLAYAAWWTCREKLRLDLYNRRFDVYGRTLDFYHALLEWAPTDMEKVSASLQESAELRKTLTAFIKASREARFLFGDDSGVYRKLEAMHADAMAVIGYKRDIGPKLNGPEMASQFGKFYESWNRIHDAFPLLEQALSKYLNFHALTAW